MPTSHVAVDYNIEKAPVSHGVGRYVELDRVCVGAVAALVSHVGVHDSTRLSGRKTLVAAVLQL